MTRTGTLLRAAARRSRRGIALPLAIVALTLVALFLAGSSFVSMQEARASSNAVAERRALEAAEYGAAAVLRDWDPLWNLSVPVGGGLGPWTHALAGGATASVRVTRATPTTFWAVSEGASGVPAVDRHARRVVAALLRLDPEDGGITAALTVRDSAAVTATGLVSGLDSLITVPADPLCTAAPAALAGIAAPDTLRICDGACGTPAGSVTGAPPLAADTGASNPLHYGATPPGAWSALAARANVLLPPNAVVTPAPAASGGGCLHTAPGNWGDPTPLSACHGWLPVIHAPGDVTIRGGLGQGILLADGDVRLDAGARFHGLIVAGDDIVVTGSASVIGAALAGDAVPGNGDHPHVTNGGSIRYSACAVGRARLAAAPLRRVRQRWWAELF
jgi:hypothetical protein